MQTRQLNAIDRAYLDGENENAPMHIPCLVFLDAAPFLDSIGRLRTSLVRTHVRQRWATFEAAHLELRPDDDSRRAYEWQVASDLDLRNHINVVRVTGKGTDRDVLDCCAKILEPRMDRSLPMWRLHLLTGVADNRIGMLFQIHHALADGVGGAAMLIALTDQGNPATFAETERRNGPMDRLRSVLTHVPEVVFGTLTEARNLTDGTAHFLQTLRRRATTSLNVPVSPNRRLDVITLELCEVLSASHSQGVSVNDLMLASITGAIRKVLVDRGDNVQGLQLEALVPVCTRSSVNSSDYGNHTAVLQVPLPVGIATPTERLQLVSAAMTTRKKHHVASAVAALEAMAQYVPLPFVANLSKGLFDHQEFVNVAISNVRGPQFPLTILGSPLRSIVAFLPLASDLPVSFGIFSYDQSLSVGILSDPSAFPEGSNIGAELVHQLLLLGTHTNEDS